MLNLSLSVLQATDTSVNYKLALEHLPVTEKQQGYLPSACAAPAADLQHSLKGIQRGE